MGRRHGDQVIGVELLMSGAEDDGAPIAGLILTTRGYTTPQVLVTPEPRTVTGF